MATIQSLIEQLNNGSIPQQIAAAEQLARAGEGAYAAMVALVRGCGSTDEDVRNWCGAALEESGPPDEDQIDALAALAAAANADVAYWAVTLLGTAGRKAEAATPVLADRLNDPSTPTVQQRAAWALGRIAPTDPRAKAALLEAAEGAGPAASQARHALQQIRAA